MTRFSRAAGAALALVLAAACARQGAPTGGVQDRIPPVVVSVEPEPFAVVEPGTDRLRVRFNERISEQAGSGMLEDAVQISPEVAELEVEHKRDGLDIKIPGGLRPGVAYTIRIVPILRDMFGNPMAVPFEWAVSTGGDFSENAVVGQVWDRATGEYLRDVRVVMTPDLREGEDTLRYAVTSGEEGLYALRTLPSGTFRLEAFQDRNRNRELDAGEPRGSVRDSLGPADTLFRSLPILVPDTTAAVLAQAEVLDSLVVRLVFDDFVDPTVPVEGVAVTLGPDTAQVPPEQAGLVPDSLRGDPEAIPAVARTFHEGEWFAYREALAAARDSLFRAAIDAARSAGDTVRADSLAEAGPDPVPGGPVRAAGPGGRGGPGGGATLPDGSPRPAPSLVILLDGPLPAGISLLFRVEGVVNLNGLPGGGGAVPVMWVPQVAEPAAADTTGVLPDSAAIPDTGRVAVPPQGRGSVLLQRR